MQDRINSFDVELIFATPRKLPRAQNLQGRVVVLDIAFASGKGFAKISAPFIHDLDERLAAWVDHHDHEQHETFRGDNRFILSTKAEHGACPEMIDAALIERIGKIDTIVCHTDFDGLASAAKWLRKGIQPYPQCDADARCIDTRLGKASAVGVMMDRALRARPRDNALFGIVVRHLASGLQDKALWPTIKQAAHELKTIEAETRKLALGYVRLPQGVAVVDISDRRAQIDKTMLLLLGQEREKIAMLVDRDTLNLAAPFDSGINLLGILGLSGGMPTRVSVPRKRLPKVCEALGIDCEEVEALLAS